ncbi:MAG: B12-binding domain-containing protein [Solirubrobacteraceae bacterium]|jgi:methanogenic corrinoid protein MtbC1|nr:B12-binding domain-containing protein [Solirubrobacteraceae bacterium]
MDLPEHQPIGEHLRATAGALREAYRAALVAGREREAERAIREAIDAGLPETVIGGDIIAPAMREVGDRWAAGELSVADEHLATEVSTRVIALQREHFRVARRRASRRVLLTALEGERHVLGLEMAASVLLHAGYDVRLLGADLPLDELVVAVERHAPDVVGITVGRPATAMMLPVAVDLIHDVRAGTPIVIGGRAAEEVRSVGPGIARCLHVADAVETVDALVQRAELN